MGWGRGSRADEEYRKSETVIRFCEESNDTISNRLSRNLFIPDIGRGDSLSLSHAEFLTPSLFIFPEQDPIIDFEVPLLFSPTPFQTKIPQTGIQPPPALFPILGTDFPN